MFTSAATRRWLCCAVLAIVAFTIVTAWVVAAQGPTGVDAAVTRAVSTIRTGSLTVLATAVTTLGSFPVVVGVAVVGAIALRQRTSRLLLSLIMIITIVETAAMVFLIKEVVGRDRPPSVSVLGAVSTDGSFPSGHTTNGTVVYVLSALLLGSTLSHRWTRRLLLTAAVVVALSIGATRVYLGYHWASDVLGGWLLATAICGAAAVGVCRLAPVEDRAERVEQPDVTGSSVGARVGAPLKGCPAADRTDPPSSPVRHP